jgi:catechol 2,3-dioxygenase-like lactoylglutathione lyase family enzyme
MHIQEVHLISSNLDAQEGFYGKKLGLPIQRLSETELSIQCGENELFFHQRKPSPYFYHFAFLIPTGALEHAIAFAHRNNFDLLPYRGKNIIHFENGRAIYFYDADNNIAEFIERPLLNYPPKSSFSINDLIKINEIGIPTTTPLLQANLLCEEYGIVPMSAEHFDNEFCWVGNHEGVILTVVAGRNWLPTNRPCIASPTMVKYVSEGKSYVYRSDWPF